MRDFGWLIIGDASSDSWVTFLSWQKDTEDEVRDIIRSNIHLQGKVSPVYSKARLASAHWLVSLYSSILNNVNLAVKRVKLYYFNQYYPSWESFWTDPQGNKCVLKQLIRDCQTLKTMSLVDIKIGMSFIYLSLRTFRRQVSTRIWDFTPRAQKLDLCTVFKSH